MYYPIVYGIPLCKNKSIIIPTLHDEIVAYFPIYKDLLSVDLIYSFNTPEELEVYKKIYNRVPEKYSIIGTCITLNPISIPDKPNIYGNYILYVGRVDSGKGVGQLISFFKEWKKRYNYDQQTQSQTDAVDNNLMRQSDPRMPLFKENKSSSSGGK